MGILSDYLAAALRSATYRLGEGGYVEASVPKLGLQTRAPNFEECRNRLADELERWLARVLLAHEQIPELGGVEAPLQELALSVDPLSNPTEQAILQHVRTLLEEVRTLRKSLQPTPPPKEAPKSIPRVTDYLASLGLGLQVARNGLPEGEERFLDRVSLFLGERFHQLAGLYEKLKASAAKGGGDFQYSLKEASQQEIGSSTQFCTILKENGLLQNYRYNSTQRRIYARLSGEGKVHNFITGGWLERYVRQEVLSVVRRKNVPYDLVANPLLVYPNGDKFELDLLLRTPEAFWVIECKTGAFEEALERHQRIASDLRLNPRQVIYVLLGVEAPQLEEFSSRFGFTFVNEASLEATLEELL